MTLTSICVGSAFQSPDEKKKLIMGRKVISCERNWHVKSTAFPLTLLLMYTPQQFLLFPKAIYRILIKPDQLSWQNMYETRIDNSCWLRSKHNSLNYLRWSPATMPLHVDMFSMLSEPHSDYHMEVLETTCIKVRQPSLRKQKEMLLSFSVYTCVNIFYWYLCISYA